MAHLPYVDATSTGATVVGNYRGNGSPYIPRNLILRYTAPGEVVLDQMMGSGTTLVECNLLGRSAVGVDINPDAMSAHILHQVWKSLKGY